MIGHHFSISAFCDSPRASGVCWARGKVSCATSARHARIIGSAKALVTAAFNLAMISFGAPSAAKAHATARCRTRAIPRRPELGCQARMTGLCGDPKGLDRAGTHLRQGDDRIGDRHVNLTCHQVLDGGSGSPIRHQLKPRARFSLEEEAGDMPPPPVPPTPCVALSGLALNQAIRPFRSFAGIDGEGIDSCGHCSRRLASAGARR
jgi:hypothetical protein